MLHIPPGGHVCLFYDSPIEQLPALVPYLQQGLASREQVLYVADDLSVEELTRFLCDAGIDVGYATATGSLKLLTRDEWRLPGSLDARTKAAQVRRFVNDARNSGFQGIRFAVEMTWTLGPNVEVRALEEWEATLNTLFTPDFPARIVCQYSRRRLSPEVIRAALHTHPAAVFRNQLAANSFYQAPLLLSSNARENGDSSQGRKEVDWMLRQMNRASLFEQERTTSAYSKAAGEQARMHQQRLEQLLNNVQDGFCVLDDRWRFTFLNAAAEGLLGRQLTGTNIWEQFPQFLGTAIERALHQAAINRIQTRFEYFHPKSGRWYEASAAPSLPSGASISFREVTDRKLSPSPQRAPQPLDNSASDLETLYDMSLRLARPMELQETLQEVLKTALSVFGSDLGLLLLCHPPDGSLRVGASSGFPAELLPPVSPVPSGEICGGTPILKGDSVVIEDVETEPVSDAYREAARRAGFRAVHSTTLVTCSDRAIGALSIHFRSPRRPTRPEIRLLELFARQAADRIENARIREQGERDSAERLKVEQALRLSEERFRLAAHTDALTLYEQDADLRYVWLYPSHPEHAGAIGKTDLDLLPNAEGATLSDLKRDVIRTGITRKTEVQATLIDGTHHYEVFVSPRRNRAGETVGVSGVALDVTSNKRSALQQRALYELVAAVNSARALDEIYDAALDAICRCHRVDRASILLYDKERVMRFKAWRGLSEQYRRAVEGHSPWSPDNPDPQVIWIDDISEASLDPGLKSVVEGEGIRALAFIPITYEMQLLGKFMIYYTAPHRFTPDEIRPAQTIASQIAFALQRQKTGEALERLVDERTASLREAIAQMEEFSYSVSHDLRAPVRAMQGYARAVLEDCAEQLDAQGKDFLERIVRNGTRMDRLIQDILTYSRLSRREIQLQAVSIGKLVREIITQYPEMQPPRAEIELVEPLHDVLAHEPSLSQAISNLLSNAVKFVSPGQLPRVRLATERRGAQVRFWVEDNGIGIRREHQHRLFGMFERIHPEHKYEGTGIGLAIVRKAVERMGGCVGVQSDTTGSRFWIELPEVSTTKIL